MSQSEEIQGISDDANIDQEDLQTTTTTAMTNNNTSSQEPKAGFSGTLYSHHQVLEDDLALSPQEEEVDEEEEEDAQKEEGKMFRTFTKLPQVYQFMPNSVNEEEEEEHNRAAVLKLLKAKEIETEALLKDIVESLPIPENASVSELAKIWKEETRQKVTKMSAVFSHKVGPLIDLLCDQKISEIVNQSFARIEPLNVDAIEMITSYKHCFNSFMDAEEYVSFRTANQVLVGNISLKDLYILTFFAMATCRRTKNDNLLQLGMVGMSTSGKSTIFESILLEGSHITTNETGCGRYQVGNKPVLLFHDVEIRTLACGTDTEKIKALARTEPAATKVHSTILNLPCLFIFYSSNERMMDHGFKVKSAFDRSGDGGPKTMSQAVLTQSEQGNKMSYASKKGKAPATKQAKWEVYPSQVNQPGKKRVSDDMLCAVQSRFIEAFVRAPPPIDANYMPKYGGFSRMHGILGMYKRVARILNFYQPADFQSPVLVQYVLNGLCNNYAAYTSLFCTKEKVSTCLKRLIEKYDKSTPTYSLDLSNLQDYLKEQ